MTSWPEWTDPQFLDANGVGGMNAAEGVVSGSVASAGSGAWAAPGLLAPESMTVAFSGLVGAIGLPPPWGLVASSGAVVRAHGTQTGTDTTSYSVDFTPLVPVSGSITAYLAATIAQIQQDPFPITGPPQGDPAYNPNFVPTVGYATNQYSVALAAASGGIDNVGTFELLRTTLTAGQVAITSYDLAYQSRATPRSAQAAADLASGGMLSVAQLQQMLVPAAPGLTSTLPPAAAAAGLFARGFNTTGGAWTIAASGTDRIQAQGTALASIGVAASGSFSLWCDGFGWWQMTVPATRHKAIYQINGGVQQVSIDNGAFTATNATIIPPPPNGRASVRGWGAGGGAGGCNLDGISGPGGGGGYFEVELTGLTGNTAVSVGAGGAGGSATGPTDGSAGGNTTVGGITAFGGAGGGAESGAGEGAPGTGGVVSGAVAFARSGLSGSFGYNPGSIYIAGLGGGSFGCGMNAPLVGNVASIGSAGQMPGQGATGSIIAAGGSAGADGTVIAEWET